MSITKRTFLIVCCMISAILLTLNTATYLLFRYSITQHLITSQAAIVQANVRLSSVFTQTVDQLTYEYTSDEQLGILLSKPIGQDELTDLNTKYSLNNCLASQLYAQSLLLNNGFQVELYVNPELPVSDLFLAANTIANVSNVFSGEMVADEEWYRNALERRSGQYIFVDEEQSRLCFACKLQNSFYTGPHQKEGVGVLLGSIPISQIPRLLSLVPVTEHSGFLLLNDQGKQVFCSEDLKELAVSDVSFVPTELSTQMVIGDEQYLCSSRELQWGLQLVFLMPYRDISHQVWLMMSPYLICSAVFMVLGIILSLVLSTGVSRPVVQFTKKLEAIQDTRGIRWDDTCVQGPLEIQRLNRSFGGLLRRINALIEEVREKENLKRESDLRALQAQINPHFMLNAMNAVNYMALEREQDDIAATVDSIASLMRYSITEPDSLVTVSTELDNIREYISVYVLRFRQEIHLELLPGLPADQVVIPKFTLQPLVENSMRHGITRQDTGITVFIRSYEENGELRVDVTDTGAGADAEKLNDYLDYKKVDLQVTHGFGIRNVNERLKLRFPDCGNLRYLNYDGKRLLARITLPAASAHPVSGGGA